MTNVISFAKQVFRFGLAGLGATLIATGAQAQVQPGGSDAFNLPDDVSFVVTPADPNMRRATARVNGNIITGTDVDHRVALILAAQQTEVAPEEVARLRLQVLRNLIDEVLRIQEASAQDMPVSADEIGSQYERYASEARGMTTSEMDAYLYSIGSSPRSVRRQIEGELAWDRLLRRNVAPFVNVSEAEANELLDRLESSRGSIEYRLGEIFLPANPVNREQVMANAEQIIQRLREGGSFFAYARQFSQASSAVAGGDLGWLQLPQLQQPQLEAAAAQMTPGQVVGPLEIPGGFSILLMIDQRQVGMSDPRDATLSLKQISLDFPADMAMEQREQRGRQFLAAVQAMNGCGDANARAASVGATTVDNDAISARQLPEEFQRVLLELNVGQTTAPFGDLNDGIRVLMLCGRDDPREMAGPSLDQVIAQLEDERIGRRAQRYMRDLRRDAVIEYN